jgi:hypothetical protein
MPLQASCFEQSAQCLSSLGIHSLTSLHPAYILCLAAWVLCVFYIQHTLFSCRRNLPVIAYEAVELNMTAAVDKELNLLQHIRDFNIDAFLKSLGYTSQQAGSDVIMRPPSTSNIDAAPGARLAGRRRMLALPPRKR